MVTLDWPSVISSSKSRSKLNFSILRHFESPYEAEFKLAGPMQVISTIEYWLQRLFRKASLKELESSQPGWLDGWAPKYTGS
jgi:hypothetical protein